MHFNCLVPDMECADCAARVEQSLRSLPGVLSVTTAVMSQKVTVEYESDVTDEGRIALAIGQAGYTVEATGGGHEEEPSFWKDREKALTALAGVFFFAGLSVKLIWPEAYHVPFWQGHIGAAGVLLLMAAFLGGLNFFPAGFAALRALSLDMNFLMTAAILGAVGIGEYSEAAAIAFLFSVAELLEDYAIDRARNSLKTLMALAPDRATVRRDGEELVVPAGEVKRGEVVIVRPGEKIPVDGEVADGVSAVDQSSITGESMPVTKEIDDEVFAGSINREGYLEVRTARPASESTLSRIVRMVEEAETHRSPSEQFVRRFARFYTPVVTVLALAVMLVAPLAFGAEFGTWFVRGLTLLVIACPCALVISTPVAVVSGITSAARNGVLIKGGNYLEALGDIRAVAFDKTGTLTHGRPTVTDVVPLNGQTEEAVLRIAATLEQRSRHPVAQAVVQRAKGLTLSGVADFESITGKGVRGRIDGTMYIVGKPELFSDGGDGHIDSLRMEGKTAVLVGTETEVMGAVAVADTVRPDAKAAIAALHREGIRHVVMLTGDNEVTARAIAAELGIDEWRSELLPDQKVAAIEALKRQYGSVAMVGDGVNDAPALAAATVGIAMGAAGTDTALETADAALMADDLSKLSYMFHLSRAARRVIRQNVFAAILIKFALAAGVLPGAVTLVVAVLVGDMGAALAVTGNAMRLARVNPLPPTPSPASGRGGA